MPPPQDRTLRTALSLWLTAVDSGLTPAQASWLRTRLRSVAPLTDAEKGKLRGPLLAWGRRQGIAAKIAAHFEAGEHDDHSPIS